MAPNGETSTGKASPEDTEDTTNGDEQQLAVAASTSCSSAQWSRIIYRIHQPILNILHRITHAAATRPKTHITSVILISLSLILAGLSTNFEVDDEEDTLWAPDPSKSLSHGQWIDHKSGFPPEPRFFVMVVHTDGNNVLSAEGAARVFEAVDTARQTEGYKDICPETCFIDAVTRFWNDTTSIFQEEIGGNDDAAIQAMSAEKYPDGTPVDTLSIMGNFERNEDTGLLTFAQSYQIYIDIPDNEQAEDYESRVNDQIVALRAAWRSDDSTDFVVEIYTDTAFNEEFDRALEEDLTLVPVVFIIMGVFTAIVFFKCHKVHSRSLMGFGAVVSVLLSIMSGYGLLFIIGTPFTSLTQILPFILFGIGLDDAYVLVGSYDRTDHKKDAVERVKDTMDDVGVSVTMTTMTSTAAFGLGCISSIPAVKWLCLYAFPTVAFVLLYQLTFFIAVIVLDEKRVQDNRRDCCVCYTVKVVEDNDDEQQDDDQNGSRQEDGWHPVEETMTHRLMTWYAKQLMRPFVKVFVLVAAAAAVVGFAYSASKLEQEFQFTDVLPDDSYVADFWEAFNDYSSREGLVPNAYFRYVDQSDPNVQAQMEKYVNDLVALDEIPEQPPHFWLRDFLSFVQQTDSLESKSFNEQLDLFLQDPVYSLLHASDIVRNENGDIVESRCQLYMDDVDQDNVKEQIDALMNQREVSSSQHINQGRNNWAFFTFDSEYYFWEFYNAAAEELAVTTIIGVVAVSAISFFLIPHWTAVLFVAPLICVLYIDLLGFMQACGLHINPVSYVALVMSIGLLVDFIMHMLLAYYEHQAAHVKKRWLAHCRPWVHPFCSAAHPRFWE